MVSILRGAGVGPENLLAVRLGHDKQYCTIQLIVIFTNYLQVLIVIVFFLDNWGGKSVDIRFGDRYHVMQRRFWHSACIGPGHKIRRLCISLCPFKLDASHQDTTMSSFEVNNLFGVSGKVVLVTGGSRGIGKMVSSCVT